MSCRSPPATRNQRESANRRPRPRPQPADRRSRPRRPTLTAAGTAHAVRDTSRDTSPGAADDRQRLPEASDAEPQVAGRVCWRRGEPIAASARPEARHCGKRCRQAASRARLALARGPTPTRRRARRRRPQQAARRATRRPSAIAVDSRAALAVDPSAATVSCFGRAAPPAAVPIECLPGADRVRVGRPRSASSTLADSVSPRLNGPLFTPLIPNAPGLTAASPSPPP